MSDVPESPSDFFKSYIPARVAASQNRLAGKTSAGAMTFRVLDAGEWSLRIKEGVLEIEEGMSDDVLLQLSVRGADFGPIFVEAARSHASTPSPEHELFAFKALSTPPERAKLVRAILGTMAFVIQDGDTSRTLAVTPGSQAPKVDAPDCRLECTMIDFQDMQSGKTQPIQLVMGGKMKMVGNAQIAMALSGVFA